MTLQLSYNFLVFFKYKTYPMTIGYSGEYGELASAMFDRNRINI